MTEAREKFFEIVDTLKKEKKIKSTLELAIWTDSGKIAALDPTDAEDWFTVSEIGTDVTGEKLDTFSVGGDTFTIMHSTKAKCPSCWKQKSSDEESLCERCSKVVG
jgi:isoleucyl-tRNA synthetase